MLEHYWPFMVFGAVIGAGYGYWREGKVGSPLGWKLFGVFASAFIGATVLVVGTFLSVMVMWAMSL